MDSEKLSKFLKLIEDSPIFDPRNFHQVVTVPCSGDTLVVDILNQPRPYDGPFSYLVIFEEPLDDDVLEEVEDAAGIRYFLMVPLEYGQLNPRHVQVQDFTEAMTVEMLYMVQKEIGESRFRFTPRPGVSPADFEYVPEMIRVTDSPEILGF